MCSLPYQALNLTRNPFGELDRELRAQVAVVDRERLRAYFAQDDFILQLVGDHGRGKSTHLIAMQQMMPSIAYTQLYPNENADIPCGNRQFIDSIENLSFWRRQLLYRQYDWLAVTTHKDLSWEMRLSNKRIKTVYISQNDSAALLRMFNKRIELARRDTEGKIPLLTMTRVLALQAAHGDDIRAMESELYDEFYDQDQLAHG